MLVYGEIQRNLLFTQVFGNAETFLAFLQNNGVPLKITVENAELLYYLLYARYGNSHIANNDENQFKYRLASTIFMYGPTWEKELEVQDALRNLTLAELQTGSKQIANHAYNPSTAPSTAALEELPKIDQQNTLTWKKSPLEGYNYLLDLLSADVTNRFIGRFKDLFLKFVLPHEEFIYESEVDKNGN